jgi:hypothetical protein
MKKSVKFYLFANAILLVGAIMWIILAIVNKWDILGFFTTSRAIAMYVIIAIDLVVSLYFLGKKLLDRK